MKSFLFIAAIYLFISQNVFSQSNNYNNGNGTILKIETINNEIWEYRKHIQKRKDEIFKILEKGKSEKLSVIEKHDLLKLQKELKLLDNTYIAEVPEYLLINENLEEVENLKIEAEELLNELIYKRKKQCRIN